MVKILEDLHSEDHFGIIAFDGSVESWRPLLNQAIKENISEAKVYAKNIEAGGCKQNCNHHMPDDKGQLCFTKILS